MVAMKLFQNEAVIEAILENHEEFTGNLKFNMWI